MKTKNKTIKKWIGYLVGLTLVVCFVVNLFRAVTGTSQTTTTVKDPMQNQYFELRATTINNVEGQGKQVIMELWAHDIEYIKGLLVRFKYDKNKFQTSNLITNVETGEESEYFNFQGDYADLLEMYEFADDGTGAINLNDEVKAVSNIVKMLITPNPEIESNPKLITESGIEGKVVSTSGDVLIGKMSFKMLTEQFDFSGFQLVESIYSPTTGIKINLDGQNCYQAQSTFIFTNETASRDAILSDLIVSRGEINEENPDSSTYKEYTLTPITEEVVDQGFNKDIKKYELEILEYIDTLDVKAVQSDENSTMKISVAKRDEHGNIKYEEDGTTIIYEEKELMNKTAMNVILNKLGEPDTLIKVKVTAEDGETTDEYEILVKRPYGTLKGSIFTGPTSLLNYFKSNIRIYSSSEVAQAGIEWNNYQTIIGGDDLHQKLIEIESLSYETKDDGTFEIYLVPGIYDILFDKEAYLDNIYTSQQIIRDNETDLGQTVLYAGDLDKNGVVNSLDMALITTRYSMYTTDEGIQESYDLNLDTVINSLDIAYVTVNYSRTREIN